MIKTFEECGFKDGDYETYIDEVSITYHQPCDCTGQDDSDGQSITLSARNNGMARFINVKTDSWSINDAEEIKKLVNDFCDRAGIKKDEYEQDRKETEQETAE